MNISGVFHPCQQALLKSYVVPKLIWQAAGMYFKVLNEMGLVVEHGLIGQLGQAYMFLLQQPLKHIPEPNGFNKILGTLSQIFLKKAVKRGFV